MANIVDSCKYCKSYESGVCYCGPWLIVKIFGPMYNVPKTAWCNRFDRKTR